MQKEDAPNKLYHRSLMIELLVKENAIIKEAQYPKISIPDNSNGYSYIGLVMLHVISLTTPNGLRIMIEFNDFSTS